MEIILGFSLKLIQSAEDSHEGTSWPPLATCVCDKCTITEYSTVVKEQGMDEGMLNISHNAMICLVGRIFSVTIVNFIGDRCILGFLTYPHLLLCCIASYGVGVEVVG